MASRLHIAGGASCGPVAVGAVTSGIDQDVDAAIKAAANEDGEFPASLAPGPNGAGGSNFRHQARGAELLGWTLYDPASGNAVSAKSIPRAIPRPSEQEFQKALTLAEFLSQNKSADLLLCLLEPPPIQGMERHTVAVDGAKFYDCNTGGTVLDANGIIARSQTIASSKPSLLDLRLRRRKHAYMGLPLLFHGSVPALGQKRQFRDIRDRSALPSIAAATRRAASGREGP